MELIAEIPTPSVKDTLPWQITRLFIWIVIGVPRMIKYMPTYFDEKRKKVLEEKERYMLFHINILFNKILFKKIVAYIFR